MKIADLRAGKKNVNITATIDFIGEKRRSSGFGAESYCQIFIKDDTGEIKMALFGEDLLKAKEGKKIKITKGYVTEYNGDLQLNTTREHPIEFIK